MKPIDSARAAFERARGYPWARPVLRLLLAVAGLTVLVVVGRATFAVAHPAAIQPDDGSAALAQPPASAEAAASAVKPPAAEERPAAAPAAVPEPVATAPAVHGPATPDDPVVLNDATVDDLQRLPGVGQKRALAILELRTRLGRFHQIEDLLKVRGIGLKTLRRLRPLLRLDRPAADAGAG